MAARTFGFQVFQYKADWLFPTCELRSSKNKGFLYPRTRKLSRPYPTRIWILWVLLFNDARQRGTLKPSPHRSSGAPDNLNLSHGRVPQRELCGINSAAALHQEGFLPGFQALVHMEPWLLFGYKMVKNQAPLNWREVYFEGQ